MVEKDLTSGVPIYYIPDEKAARTLILSKKLLESLLYSHYGMQLYVGNFLEGEIEEISLEGKNVKIVYKKKEVK